MFKIGMALTFAVIGAMIVLLAGIFGGARISTAFIRMFCTLLVTCAGVWIFLFILEARGVVDIDKKLRIIEDEEEAEVAEEAELTEAQEPADEEGGFEPLAADDLQHMDTAEEEEETRAS